MKKLILLELFLGLYCFASPISGTLTRIRLETQYSYKDPKVECSTKTAVGNTHDGGEAYLELKMEKDKILSAKISNHLPTWPYQYIYKSIDLLPSEVAKIELFTDKKNQVWLKKFNLTERLAKWLVYFPSQRNFSCKVPSEPKNVSFHPESVSFETEGLEMGVDVSYGEWLELKGLSLTNIPFEEKLRLVQRKVNSFND